MPLTWWYILVSIAGPVLIGVPLAWAAFGFRVLDRKGWLLSPFLGVAAIVLPLQNLVYLDRPIAGTAWIIWTAAGLGWLAILLRGQVWASVKNIPVTTFLVALGVYLFQGYGLLKMGAEEYAGRARTDHFNYLAIAEFLATLPYHTPPGDVVLNHPWMTVAAGLKSDRIGQSILQAFLMVTTGGSPRALFEPTILLVTAGTVLAVVLLAELLGFRPLHANLLGALGGLLPATTLLHLDCYQSHALAVPLLLLAPVWIDDLIQRVDGPSFIRGLLLFNLTASIYTEFVPILVGMLGLSVVLALVFRCLNARLCLAVAGIVASPIVVNYFYAVAAFLSIAGRVDVKVLQTVYPDALWVSGWGRVWWGDLAEHRWLQDTSRARIATLLLFGIGLLGLARLWRHAWPLAGIPWRDGQTFRPFLLGLLVLLLAMLPLLVVMKDSQHPYQVYKLLISVAPLFAIGIASWGLHRGRVAHGATLGLLVVLTGLSSFATLKMTQAMTKPPFGKNELAASLHTPDMRQLKVLLEQSPNKQVVIAPADIYENWWLAYFARSGDVRATQSMMGHAYGKTVHELNARLLDLKPDAWIVTPVARLFRQIQPGNMAVRFEGKQYMVREAQSTNWAVPLSSSAFNSIIEQVDGQPFLWVGSTELTLDFLAGGEGEIVIRGEFVSGSALPSTTRRRLRWATSQGIVRTQVTNDGWSEIAIPVSAGRVELKVACQDAPDETMKRGGDPRIMLVGLKGLEMEFRPRSDDADFKQLAQREGEIE